MSYRLRPAREPDGQMLATPTESQVAGLLLGESPGELVAGLRRHCCRNTAPFGTFKAFITERDCVSCAASTWIAAIKNSRSWPDEPVTSKSPYSYRRQSPPSTAGLFVATALRTANC